MAPSSTASGSDPAPKVLRLSPIEALPPEIQRMILEELVQQPDGLLQYICSSPVIAHAWRCDSNVILVKLIDGILTEPAIATGLRILHFEKHGNPRAVVERVNQQKPPPLKDVEVPLLGGLWALCLRIKPLVTDSLLQKWLGKRTWHPNGITVQRFWRTSFEATGQLGWKDVQSELTGRLYNGFFNMRLYFLLKFMDGDENDLSPEELRHWNPWSQQYLRDIMSSQVPMDVFPINGATWVSDHHQHHSIDLMLANTTLDYRYRQLQQSLHAWAERKNRNAPRDGKLCVRQTPMIAVIVNELFTKQKDSWVNVDMKNPDDLLSGPEWDRENNELKALDYFESGFLLWARDLEYAYIDNGRHVEIRPLCTYTPANPRAEEFLFEAWSEAVRSLQERHPRKEEDRKSRAAARAAGISAGRVARRGTKTLRDTLALRKVMFAEQESSSEADCGDLRAENASG